MKALTPSQMKTFVINCLKIGEIPYISGQPAIGKSDLTAQVADEFYMKLLDIRLSQKLPEDLSGLPSLNPVTGKAEYNPFDTFPMEGDPLPLDKDGNEMNGWLIFLDELSSATEEVMAAIYSLLLGHTVGGKKVHPKAVIVAAGNRASDSAIARELPDTLITRMLPKEMKVSSKDWLKWSKDHGDVHDAVYEFIKKYPDMLIGTVDPKTRTELETYHNPRGWGKVSKIIRLHEAECKKPKASRKDSAGVPVSQITSGDVISPAIQAMLFSTIGSMASVAFKEHYDDTIQIALPWEIAQSPSSAKIPHNNIGKAKVTAYCAEFFIDTQEQSRDAILVYMNRMDAEHSSLFVQILKETLGNTVSDAKLIDSVSKRLNVVGLQDMPLAPELPSTAFQTGE